MARQFASITLATLLTALWSIEIPTAEAGQQCSAAMPLKPARSLWSYRLIDGRKCWYEGKPGLSKSLLEWPKEASAQPASDEEITSADPQKPRTPLDSQAWAPNSRAWAPTDPDAFEIYRWYAAALGQLGRPAEAKEALEKAVSRTPAAFDMYVRNRAPWFRPEDHAHLVEGLRKAGWKGLR